ncbi:DUF3298 domain-containing protein [bacterium]|nr:MAG: DUF3298 domain-containing protein [bacterium]
MKKLPAFLSVTLLLLLTPPSIALAAPAGSVVWQMATLAEGFEGCDPKSETGRCSYISFRFPAIMAGPSESVEEAIREDIRQFLYSEGSYQGKDYFEISKRLFRDYGMFKAHFPDSAQVWYLEKEVGVIRLTSTILTLSKRSVSYLGGAHPITEKFFSSIDLKSGKVLRLHDVIEPDAIGQLVVKAEERFRKIKGLSPDAGLDGFSFPDGRFRLNDNIGLTSEGLLFYYNVFEIEPYAAGPTELVIPYDELKDLALPGGPLNGLGK